MKKRTQQFSLKSILVLGLFSGVLSTGALAQNVSVSGAVSGNGSYPDLVSAFTAINGGTQTGANISVQILASTTETASAVLNGGAWSTLSITPSGGNFTVTGNISGPLVDLNGADNVLINGLNTGGNALTLSNTNTLNLTTSTLRLIGDATFNTLTNCTFLGSTTSAALGVITFSTGTSLGNSNNVISSCNVGPAGTNLPVNGIFSSGTLSFENKNNVIQSCSIYDFFSASLATSGILISSNNSNWSITGNKLYQTATRTYTTANTHKAIAIGAGNAYTVSGNSVGYSSAATTGTYVMGGTIATRFIAIELSVGTLTASSVQANTVTAITLTTSSGAATTNGIICGINIIGGNVNVGTVSGNLIGGSSGANLINGFPTTTQGLVVGINCSSTGTINIQNNYIGGCSSTGTTAAVAGAIMGINISGAAGLLSITGNTIGNPTTDNMRAGTLGLTTGNSLFVGINFASASTGTVNVSGNVLRNFASYGTNTSGTMRGIYTTGTSGSTTYSIVNNSLSNFTTNNGNTSVGNGQLGSVGIAITYGVSNAITSNTISGFANTTTLTTAVCLAGISTAVSSNPVISGNYIFNFSHAGTGTTTTGPPMVFGVFVRGSSGNCTIHNNMISFGNGQSSNTSFLGICAFSGGGAPTLTRVYHNTINIEGTVGSGANPSIGIYRGNFSTSAVTFPMDIRNNLVTNSRSGGTGVHLAISNNYGATSASTSGWGLNASNNNILNANSSTVGWWNTAQTLSGWQIVSSCDGASFSGAAVTYSNSASDLHIAMGTTPNLIESNGQLISGFASDIDGQNRPGPSGSVNGGALAPDIGADEFDGSILDMSAPAITYTPLGGGCSNGDRVLTATITDYSGVPTTGSLVPAIYYKKNAGSYVSSPGALIAGSATNGTWNFTLSASAMGGLSSNDQVSYFVVAQDVAATVNIGANPSAGIVAVNVTSVTTTPTAPNSYIISSLGGTYTVGTSGTFTTLTAAANAYNTSCLTGPVTYVLTDASYSAAETYPIVFQLNTYASATNSLLIVPATGTAVTLSPTLTTITSVIKFLNARYITLDGLNSGGSSLNVINSNTASTSANIWLASSIGTGPGCNAVSIKNATLTGGNRLTSNGVVACVDGTVPSAAGGADNDNITIQGNTMSAFYNGVFAIGTATSTSGGLDGWNISNNRIGPPTSNTLTNIGLTGIFLQNLLNSSINSNTISNVIDGAGYIYGVRLFNGVTSSTMAGNVINSIKYTGTSGYSGVGLDINTNTSASNLLIQNNMISDISGDGWSNFTAGGIVGISVGPSNVSGGINFYNNSVALNAGTFAGNTTGNLSAAIQFASTSSAIDLRNNIFYTDIINSAVTATTYAIYSAASATAFTNINFNDYYVAGSQGILGYIGGGARTSMSALQTNFGQNLNSVNIQPQFNSTTDLHLQTAALTNAGINNAAQPLSGVTIDVDGQSRSSSAPDIGADEFTASGTCTSAVGGTLDVAPAFYSLCATNTVLLNSNNVSTGLGTTYNWMVSNTPGGTYTNVAASSGTNLTYFSTLPNGTYYFVLKATCSSGSLTGVSNEATVTIGTPTPATSQSVPVVCGSVGSATLYAVGAPSFSWNTGATTSSLVVSQTATTVYTLTGISPCGNGTSTISVAYSDPTVTAVAASSVICAGTAASLSASGASTYTWSSGATGASVNVTPSVSTNYTVIGTDAFGCVAMGTQSVSINPNPTVNISGSSGICTGQSASLTATGALTYSWSTGATTNSIVTSPTSNTTYTVSGYDALGCVTTTTQLVTVAASLSITITGPSSVCLGQPVNLLAGGGVTYTWNTGATSSNIAPTPSITTTYSVIGASGTCSNTALRTVSVSANPTITVSGNATVCAGQSTTLTAGGAGTYTWNTASTATSIAISPSVNTSYTVSGTSVQGCTSSAVAAVVSNSVPVITVAQSSPSVCVSSPATFTASGANTYTWSTSSNNTIITITPVSSAVYTVNGTNTLGCVSSRTFALGTFTLPIISITPASASVCAQSSVSFSGSGAATYTWNNSITTPNAVFAPATSTVYTLVGTNSSGCTSSATVGVTTFSNPIVTISPASATVCAFSPASFTANGAATYTWNATSPGSVVTLFQSSNTTHTVVGTSTDGCNVTATVDVFTNPLPVLSLTPSFTTVCAYTTFTASASGANTYSWSTGSTTGSTSITPSTAAIYSVVGTNTLGCSSSTQIIVVTNTLPVLGISPANATVCSLSPVSFTASGAASYTWSSGPTTATVTVNPSSNTIYTVSGTDAANGCVGAATVAVATNSLPVINVTPVSGTSVCPGAVTNLSASGAVTYTWLAVGANAATVAVTPTANTIYTVTGSDIIGCVGTKTVDIRLFPQPIIVATPASQTICVTESATVTPSGAINYTLEPGTLSGTVFTLSPTLLTQYTVTGTDANNCLGSGTFLIYVNQCNGLQSQSAAGYLVNVYPNPSTGVITAKFEFEGLKQVEVVNAIGQVVEMRVTENESEDFNLSQMAKGVYYVRVSSKTASGNFKVIIQ